MISRKNYFRSCQIFLNYRIFCRYNYFFLQLESSLIDCEIDRSGKVNQNLDILMNYSFITDTGHGNIIFPYRQIDNEKFPVHIGFSRKRGSVDSYCRSDYRFSGLAIFN